MSQQGSGPASARFGGDAEAYAAGQVVFRGGEAGDAMYGVRAGEVAIMLGGTEVEVVGPGGFFGEMALIDHGPRSAGAVAKTDAHLVRIDERRFQFMVQQTPFFALEVMRTIVRRLREMNARL